MADRGENADRLLAAARGGSREALGNALEAWRRYLLARKLWTRAMERLRQDWENPS